MYAFAHLIQKSAGTNGPLRNQQECTMQVERNSQFYLNLTSNMFAVITTCRALAKISSSICHPTVQTVSLVKFGILTLLPQISTISH